MTRVLDKDPSEVLDYLFDFGLRCDRDNDTISGTPTVTATPTGLTVGAPSVVSGYDSSGVAVASAGVKVRLSSGTAGQNYAVTCTATTAGGLVYEFTGTLRCTQK